MCVLVANPGEGEQHQVPAGAHFWGPLLDWHHYIAGQEGSNLSLLPSQTEETTISPLCAPTRAPLSVSSLAASLCDREASLPLLKDFATHIEFSHHDQQCPLSSLRDIFNTCLTHRAISIASDTSYSSHPLVSLLPLGKRQRSLRTDSTKLLNSFIHQAVRMLNSAHYLSPLPPASGL